MEIAYEINATVITDLQVQEWLVKAVLVQAKGSTPFTLQILGLITLRLMGSKPSIGIGVMAHRNRNWSPGLRFESFYISKAIG